jgi:hypothetical protein
MGEMEEIKEPCNECAQISLHNPVGNPREIRDGTIKVI